MAAAGGGSSLIGQTLAHFRVVEKIGAGGMGEVYRAHDEHLDRDVAIKVLPPGTFDDESARRRFRKEAQALSKLNHPHIAVVHDFDTEDGVDFLVTELIQGITLEAKLKASRALSEQEVIHIGLQIASALEEAHERGIIHCDLKPGNIIVNAKDQVKVLDFGLAKLLQTSDVAATVTQSSREAASGTVPYMSPEQLRGDPLDARSDIWALGVVLFEMASGGRPFAGKTSSMLAGAILHQSPMSPRSVRPEISPRLEEVILKCLEKNPGDRYHAAKEIATDLRRAGTQTETGLAQVTVVGRTPRRPWMRAAAAAALVLALATLAWWKLGPGIKGPTSAHSIRSLAVLPLANLSRDPEQEYFADGLTEAIITDLSKIRELSVISRTSVMRYKGVKRSLPDIARELGVDGVIEGSVLREGNQVRITVQLIDGRSDQHLWANNYHRELHGILSLQGEVAQAIAKEIAVRMTPSERERLARAPQVDPKAHEAYLMGLHHLHGPGGTGPEKAIPYFEQAIGQDPRNARAHLGLAHGFMALSTFYRSPHEMMPKAKAAALKALELDENLAEAHSVLGIISLFYDWDWAQANQSLQRALELNPSLAEAHLAYGTYFSIHGRHEEALRETRLAYALDPQSQGGYGRGLWHFLMARRYDEAIEYCGKAVRLNPQAGLAYSVMGLAWAQKGQFQEALAAADKGRQLSGSPIALAHLGVVYAEAEKPAKAKALLGELIEQAEQRYVCGYNVGQVYMAMGDRAEGFRWFERAYADRSE